METPSVPTLILGYLQPSHPVNSHHGPKCLKTNFGHCCPYPPNEAGARAVRLLAIAVCFGCVVSFPTTTCAKEPVDPKTPSRDIPAKAAELWSPLGLPRLKTKVKPGKAGNLASASYDVDGLAAPEDSKSAEGVRTFDRGNSRVLEIAAGREWKRSLKNPGKNVYTSFLLYASEGTLVAIDGAWLGVAPSQVTGCLELIVGEPKQDSSGLKWRSLGIHILQQTFGGQSMVSLPVLTVRLDRKDGVWDLYSGSTQIADNIALAKTTDADASVGSFVVRTGDGKAWVCGLVQADENPLFEDTNGNGIDDDFERTKKGALLAPTTSAAERASTAKEWRDSTRQKHQAVWLLDKPRPD